MRIAIFGSGGVGGYFGAKLARGGNDVAFVARGAHLAAMRANGLRVQSAGGDIVLPKVVATDDPSSLAPVDAVLFCVKLWDVEEAARQVVPLLAPDGVVIPFQNGIDAPDMLRQALGRDHVAGGIAYIGATIASPGVVRVVSPLNRLRIGAFFGIGEHRVTAFADVAKAAGIGVEVADDIRLALWEKFAMFSAMSGCTALARQSIGVVRSDPDLRALYERAVREAVAVGKAEGVALAPDYVDKQLAFADALNPAMKASMANDLIAGHRLELPWLSGAVVRLGRQHHVPTPIHDTIYAALKPYVNGTPH